MKDNVLVVGRDSGLAAELARLPMGRRGLEVSVALDVEDALERIRGQLPRLVLVDLSACDGDVWSFLKALSRQRNVVPTVVAGHGADAGEAVEAMKCGVAYYIPEGARNAAAVREAVEALLARQFPLTTALPHKVSELTQIVAESPEMRQTLATVQRIAPSDANVLVLGESGVGKEVIARALHELSPRRKGEFVPVNCASLSGDMLENELFGHERGAFTSADQRKIGLLEVADGGTLFLDEVNEMGLNAQAKLLRVLERGRFRRVGGTAKIAVDLRVIAAANVDLAAEIALRRFREDLYYRLNVISIVVPPLRARRSDIAALVEHFLASLKSVAGRSLRISDRAMTRLGSYSWPGNVRELKNVIEGMALMATHDLLDLTDLPPNIKAASPAPALELHVGMTMEEVEKQVLERYLETYPTKKEAARVLGIGLRTLHSKVKKYSLSRRGT